MEEVEGFVMNLRGLPFSATEDDILKFFDGINVKSGRAGIHILLSREGRPSGEAFVEVESEDDCTAAEKKDRQHIGERYIEDGINVKSGRAGIHILLSREGRPSGEAFVEVESEDDCTAAEKKDRQHIGERYIE
ncbi:heterogeneous nuclear ribonucleoprotein H2-like, partial [Diaphorina citri]|uniref:Heterogeneous nuclear ribonucleoprotein H2-like n=1 Tax=Diaphorina citri TaxID=121845 RepID=A0A3Q0JA23_DIACI